MVIIKCGFKISNPIVVQSIGLMAMFVEFIFNLLPPSPLALRLRPAGVDRNSQEKVMKKSRLLGVVYSITLLLLTESAYAVLIELDWKTLCDGLITRDTDNSVNSAI